MLDVQVFIRVTPGTSDRHWEVEEDGRSLRQVHTEGADATVRSFDRVFDGNTRNVEVFRCAMMPLIEGVFEGSNGTLFAYGYTATGKTHTLLGCEEDPGIFRLAIANILEGVQNAQNRQYMVRVSIIELYMQKFYDLLVGRANAPGNGPLMVSHDATGDFNLRGLTEEVVASEQQLLSLLQRTEMNRQVRPTPKNERSSRSHVIFRIRVEYVEAGSSDSHVAATGSHLLIVDLAGSEKMSNPGGQKDELSKEGIQIKQDLLALNKVIGELSRGRPVATYRGNSLTELLRGSLEGNVRLSILCTVDVSSANETKDTLRYLLCNQSFKIYLTI
ncbi:kinesin-like protein KIN-7D, chloroplastic [Hyalella azteca]|uniref:Kinesin-like protein n=1 Tax=Hyalella azteca TaxID=294128 RepID=A0A8B7N0Z5_HYAAZ|nr:kinesin-like protein KIN-7D, chloroplastic [Hyalella azteca]